MISRTQSGFCRDDIKVLCDKVTGSVQRLLRDSCNYVLLCSDLGSVRSVSHRLWGGLLQLQRQIKYGCNFSFVLILSNVPVGIHRPL